MDWVEDLPTTLWSFPAGMKKNGATTFNTLEWTSKYGSVSTSMYDSIVVSVVTMPVDEYDILLVQ